LLKAHSQLLGTYSQLIVIPNEVRDLQLAASSTAFKGYPWTAA